ncbi:hypothetical protein SDC9_96764 [bioreactor metagenome]|uniref:YgjP-like metallopeptidase domain-containing protein n=1 Tax=bioreactor metagenome TaxID=1076179 RepID=A0A645AA02_9ZZZZ|nr:SprT family zinc-dependent metalloprotease [Candidatus Metalachnospira sp.]
MFRSINYCGLRMEYEYIPKDIKNINIRITRDGEISVSAPLDTKPKLVDNFVEEKAEWIFRKMADFEKAREAMPDDGFYEGKTVFILGKEYTLSFDRAKKFDVKIESGEIIILSRYGDDNLKPKYLDWLAGIAKPVFEDSLTRMLYLAKDYNIKRPEIYIRNMSSRWGSCNIGKHRIGLNVQLMKKDLKCIDQVVLHEVAHFVSPDHSERFYDVLDNLMPDWKDRKNELETKWVDGIL